MDSEQIIQELHNEIDGLVHFLNEYHNIINILMSKLNEQDSENCKKIYRECYNSSTYQSYYLGGPSVQET